MIICTILICISIAALLHSYILFPSILQFLSRGKFQPLLHSGDFPETSVVLAVYNEEKVIREKIESFLQMDYPAEKIELIIGSDGSTDNTEKLIEEYIKDHINIRLHKFEGRTGKSGILNRLIPLCKGSIIILTDANIYFDKSMAKNLVSGFADPLVGLIGANIQNTGMQKKGISLQEETYIQRENLIKYREGLLWGTMMGAFGACYAVRRHLLVPIPPNHLMEDFYISMHVLKSNYKNILEPSALAYEDVSESVNEEFKRKVRISAGNFQNLAIFYRMLFPVYRPLGFCFLSHKLLRWLGPFWLLLLLICLLPLIGKNLIFTIVFSLLITGFISPIIDWLLVKMNIHSFAIRIVSYFFLMNAALFVGFIKFLKGIKTSAWQPTQRNIK